MKLVQSIKSYGKPKGNFYAKHNGFTYASNKEGFSLELLADKLIPVKAVAIWLDFSEEKSSLKIVFANMPDQTIEVLMDSEENIKKVAFLLKVFRLRTESEDVYLLEGENDHLLAHFKKKNEDFLRVISKNDISRELKHLHKMEKGLSHVIQMAAIITMFAIISVSPHALISNIIGDEKAALATFLSVEQKSNKLNLEKIKGLKLDLSRLKVAKDFDGSEINLGMAK